MKLENLPKNVWSVFGREGMTTFTTRDEARDERRRRRTTGDVEALIVRTPLTYGDSQVIR